MPNLGNAAILVVFLINFSCKDTFVASEKVRYVELTNTWQLRNKNGSITANVPKIPSGVFSALNSRYGDLLHSQNEIALRWIAYDTWIYTKTFEVNEEDYEHVQSINLTFHGIDTVATIRINGHVIGKTDNMFVRYSYDVLPYLQPENTLEIEIESPIAVAKERAEALAAEGISTPPLCEKTPAKFECHRNMLRKMQSSFGSDCGLVAPSMGIWKTVTMEYYQVAIMRDIDVALRELDANWVLDIRVVLNTGIKEDFYAELTFFAPDLLKEPVNITRRLLSYASPKIEFQIPIPKQNVILWWPNGYGLQKLYPLFFTMNCWLNAKGPNVRAKSVSQKALKIGFRTIELVEELDGNGRTFYFKVNGRPIFIKGSNYMPSHILPELATDQERIKHILSSAKASHMNMIRVWGGGLYESDYFYSMADYYGLLIWQDMTFAGSTYPKTNEFLEAVRLETIQNAARLAYHPSLALIVTNDEVELYLVKNKSDFGPDSIRLEDEYIQLFMGTIKHELNSISRNDFSPRPGPMISSPSLGIEETKKELAMNPQDPNYGDIHFWDYDSDSWSADTYPRARFVSEYGFQSLPIVASWNRVLGPKDTIADLVKRRSHDTNAFNAILKMIDRHLPFDSENWDKNIEAFIYFSQLAQALSVKTATEVFRTQYSQNHTMGALYWQLNEVWIAPSWSSIDFYGNYKILYYWSKEFLAPTVVIPLYDSVNEAMNVTLVCDLVEDCAGPYNLTVNTYLWSELYPKKKQAIFKFGAHQKIALSFSQILAQSFNKNNSFFELTLSNESGIVSKNFFFPTLISQTTGMVDPKLTAEIGTTYCNENVLSDTFMVSYSITIRIKFPAVFVYIEITHPKIVKYKLSANGFVQVEPVKTVHLEFENKASCLTLEPKHIKVLTINQFMLEGSATATSAPVVKVTKSLNKDL